MSLSPDQPERRTRARADMRMGVPIVMAEKDRGLLVIPCETLTTDRLAAFRQIEQPILSISARRADTLKARIYDGDIARIQVPDDSDISWIKAIADPVLDLHSPMKGPLRSLRDNDHALHRAAIQLAKEAHLLPAVLTVPITNPQTFARENDLTFVGTDVDGALARLQPVVNAHVPLSLAKSARLQVFRTLDGSEEHYAVIIGHPRSDTPVITRLHSACFTGDLLGSLKCDCGPQLRAALQQMGEAKTGILLYLNQEGRGIGLANKMRAYSLQDQGFDTVEANHRLGFEDDERDFRTGAEILGHLGISDIRLLTNNPAKVEMMQANGINVVERIALKVGKNSLNAAYLATKARKSGHDL